VLGANPKRVPQTGLRLQSVISTFSPKTRFITSCAEPARAFARTRQSTCSQQRDTRKNHAVARAGGKSLCSLCTRVRPRARADSGSADTLTSEITARWKSRLKSLRDDAVSARGEHCRMCEGLKGRMCTDRTLLGSLGGGAFFPKGMLRRRVLNGRCTNTHTPPHTPFKVETTIEFGI
jgi:hypothetical protein